MSVSRRQFIKGSAAIAGAAAFVPTALQRALASSVAGRPAAQVPAGERTLVVVQMAGGNDGLNTIIPANDDRYYEARPTVNVQPEDALTINREVGFHPALTAFKQLWGEGVLAAIEGVDHVVLMQEGGKDAAGFLVYMPVFDMGPDGRRALKGYIYSPFNAQDFVNSALEGLENRQVRMSIYDEVVAPDRLMAEMVSGDAGGEKVSKTVHIANRDWVLVLQSIRPAALSRLSMIALIAGLVCSTLALAIAWLLTRQAVEARQVIELLEEQAAIRNSLTRELNHRVKNTLANVLSIVSLTRRRADSIDSFAESLDGRIRALSATHDLLTQSEWGTTPVRSVIAVSRTRIVPGMRSPERVLFGVHVTSSRPLTMARRLASRFSA